jgi:effector-binding domain-containing protein
VKKILFFSSLIIFLAALSGSIIYLITRPCDYRVHFTVNTTPDVAYFNILNWHIWNRKNVGQNIEILSKIPVGEISKKLILKDTTLIFNWEFSKLSDSTTLIRACVTDVDRKIFNRLTVPFINTAFKTSVRNNLIDIKTRLEVMMKTFHYEFTGSHRFEEKSCVCVSLKSTPRGKAGAMMLNVIKLNQFVRQNDLELEGNPFVVIHNWNEYNDSISIDFCFPITHTDIVPDHPEIKYMTVDGMDAVKADFYGNYSITDVTWHTLAEKAKASGKSNNKLIEVYFNDPHSGGNELEWKAEIYLGIESEN